MNCWNSAKNSIWFITLDHINVEQNLELGEKTTRDNTQRVGHTENEKYFLLLEKTTSCETKEKCSQV